VHAIKDDSPKHVLDELGERVRAAAFPRPVHLLLENEDNQAFRLSRDERGEPTSFTAQWNDDMHHVLHTAATLESNDYYGDYKDDTEKLGRALAEGFAFQGEVMQARNASRGEPSAHLPPGAFVAFMQNHDQIGNRAFGERINAIASPEAVRAIAAIYFLLPQTPMLFMGEEWGSSQPFPFFAISRESWVSLFGGVVGGSLRISLNFKILSSENEYRIPRGGNISICEAGLGQSKEEVHTEWLEWYRRILQVRKTSVIPHAREMEGYSGLFEVIGAGAVVVRFWNAESSRQLVLAANLSDESRDGFPCPTGQVLWQEGAKRIGTIMRPWSVCWTLQGSEKK